MKRKGIIDPIFSLMILLSCIFPQTAYSETIAPADAIELNIFLSEYIEGKTKNGIYTHFNIEKLETQTLSLTKLHRKIFKRGDYFLMCANFIDKNNNVVLIDYIVRPFKDGFIVEKEVLGKRRLLTKLFERVF